MSDTGQDQNGYIDFFGDEAIRSTVENLWAKVFSKSNEVIKQAGLYGFYTMDFPQPNIHAMLDALTVVNEKLEAVIAKFESGGVGYEIARLALNAKQQIINMTFVAASLKEHNREDFDAAIDRLKSQAPF